MPTTTRLCSFASRSENSCRWFHVDLLMREDRDLQNEWFAGINWRLH
jgi:hypothetical protein